MSLPKAKEFISYLRAEDQIGGFCPSCHNLFRLSEVELFYIPDRKEDFLTELRKKERELEEQILVARKDAIKRSRSTLMGQLFETIRPFLPGFTYHPGDLRAIWDPVDFVSFNGMALNGSVESVTFVEVKTGRSYLSARQRSIKEAVESNRVSFHTVETSTLPPMEDLSDTAEQRSKLGG